MWLFYSLFFPIWRLHLLFDFLIGPIYESHMYIVINRFCEVLFLSFERRPFDLLRLFFRMFICADHVRCSPNTRSRYFVFVLGIIFWRLIRKFILGIWFLFDQKITVSVLFTFSGILFARSQSTFSFKSRFTYMLTCFGAMEFLSVTEHWIEWRSWSAI